MAYAGRVLADGALDEPDGGLAAGLSRKVAQTAR